MSETREWMCGYYDVCIPVYIDGCVSFSGKRVLVNMSLPYKVGQENNPGNVEIRRLLGACRAC